MDEVLSAEERAADLLLLEIERGWVKLDSARVVRQARQKSVETTTATRRRP